MPLRQKTVKILDLSGLPYEIIEDTDLMELERGMLHQMHISNEYDDPEIDAWIEENYPELKEEEFFFLNMDV